MIQVRSLYNRDPGYIVLRSESRLVEQDTFLYYSARLRNYALDFFARTFLSSATSSTVGSTKSYFQIHTRPP